MGSFRFEYEEDGRRQTFSFEGTSISVGRVESQDFVLDHPTVSREHAVIQDDGGGQFRLVVLSKGGLTAVDGERVQGEAQLYDGSKINFGELQFRFRSEAAPQRPAPGRGANRRGGGRDGTTEPSRSRGGEGRPGPGSGGGRSGRSDGNGARGPSASGFDQEGAVGGATEGGPGGAMADSGVGDGEFDETMGQGLDGGEEGEEEDGVEIETWDEIAREAEKDESEQGDEGGSLADSLDPSGDRRGGSGEEEETSPVLILVGVAAVAGVVYMSFFQGPGPQNNDKEGATLDDDQPPVQLEVECLSPQACKKEAEEAYNVGKAKLNKQDAEISNLFDGYKKLLRAKKLMEKAEGKKPPESMSDHEKKLKSARKQLDEIFRNYKVQYFSAEKTQNYERMLSALNTIRSYFPDETAREHRWAQKRELEMKKKGVHPSSSGGGF